MKQRLFAWWCARFGHDSPNWPEWPPPLRYALPCNRCGTSITHVLLSVAGWDESGMPVQHYPAPGEVVELMPGIEMQMRLD